MSVFARQNHSGPRSACAPSLARTCMSSSATLASTPWASKSARTCCMVLWMMRSYAACCISRRSPRPAISAGHHARSSAGAHGPSQTPRGPCCAGRAARRPLLRRRRTCVRARVVRPGGWSAYAPTEPHGKARAAPFERVFERTPHGTRARSHCHAARPLSADCPAPYTGTRKERPTSRRARQGRTVQPRCSAMGR